MRLIHHQRLLGCMALAGSLLAALAIPQRVTVAEEAGYRVALGYAEGYSTWGPTNVYGQAHVWPKSNEVALTVHYLPRLPNPGHYASWLLNHSTGQVLRIGVFDTSEAGDATQDVIFTSNFPTGVDTILVTAYPTGGDDTIPGPLRSMVGSWSTTGLVLVVPTRTPAPPQTPVPATATATSRPRATATPTPQPTETMAPSTATATGRSATATARAKTPTPSAGHRGSTGSNSRGGAKMLPHTGGGPCRPQLHRPAFCTHHGGRAIHAD